MNPYFDAAVGVILKKEKDKKATPSVEGSCRTGNNDHDHTT